MSRKTPTQVMIERCDELARDPVHLKRLMTFWPRENIVHRMAKLMLEELERNAELEAKIQSLDGQMWQLEKTGLEHKERGDKAEAWAQAMRDRGYEVIWINGFPGVKIPETGK